MGISDIFILKQNHIRVREMKLDWHVEKMVMLGKIILSLTQSSYGFSRGSRKHKHKRTEQGEMIEVTGTITTLYY